MRGICSMTMKHLAGMLLFFTALSLAAQESVPTDGQGAPPPVTPQPSEAPPVPIGGQETPSSPETPPPSEAPSVPVDSEYVEPPEEPEEFAAPPETPSSALDPLPRKAGNALYEYFAAPGETRRREPLRRFDWELFAMNVGVTNNFVGATDILRETIKINLTEMASRVGEEGVLFNADVLFKSAMHFNSSANTSGFGFFAALDGRLDLSAPETLLSWIARGNAGNTQASGAFSVSGAVFAEAGFHRYVDVKKWRIDIRPAWFVPLVYIPQSEVDFTIETDNGVSIGSFGAVTAYLPVKLNESGGTETINNFGGLDFSVAVEYALFPILDVGLDVAHIPFMPSRLTLQVQAHQPPYLELLLRIAP